MTQDIDNRLDPSPIIIDQFAETLWACAWAAWNDDNPEHPNHVNVSGCEITDVMPAEPPEARVHAVALYDRLSAMNGYQLGQRMRAVVERDESTLETLAHYLVMECLGSGVAYVDDYPDHDIEVLSYLETICDDGADLYVSGLGDTDIL